MLKYEPIDIKRVFEMKNIEYPISVYLKITTECMLNCNFCSQAGKKVEFMKLEKVKNILEQLKEIGVVYIYYTGGEPMMHKDIDKILKYGYELGFKQFVVSNGVLFSKKEKYALSKYLIGVGISLHGKSETHNKIVGNINCFEQIINNLNMIKQENKDIQININCTGINENINKDNFEYLAKICKKNEWKFTIARLNYIGNGEKYSKIDLNNMLEIVNELNNKGYEINISNCIAPCVVDKKFLYLTHGCGAGHTIAAIESNGDVKICASSNIAIGNIYENDFEKIWKSHILKEYKKFKWLKKKCKVCKHFYVCKGGCKAELTGKYWEQFCDATVENNDTNMWNKIKDKPIILAFEYLRKNKKDYIIIGTSIRECNSTTKEVIMKINGKRTGQEIVDNYNGHEYEIKDLLLAMKEDGLIEIKE